VSFHTFRGQRHGKPQQRNRGFSQATMRHNVFTFDQNGRKWSFPAENSTGKPCGLIEPTFSAPYQPDAQYLIINEENTSEMYVDWRSLIRDRIAAMKEYHAQAVQLAAKKGWEIPKLGDYSDDLIGAHPSGKPPRAYQLAVAAEQGNPWVLGFSPIPDPRLERYLELPSMEIDEEIESYDFGASSYSQEIASPGSQPTKRPSTFAARRAAASRAPNATDWVAAAEAEAEAQALEIETAVGDIDQLGAEGDETETELDDIDELETIPTDAEGAEASAGTDDDDLLIDDDEGDPQGMGGRTVKPQNMDRAARQAPRRPGSTAKTRKRGAQASASGGPVPSGGGNLGNKPFVRDGRKSLADGAAPVISN
jgi:hypothetical protein